MKYKAGKLQKTTIKNVVDVKCVSHNAVTEKGTGKKVVVPKMPIIPLRAKPIAHVFRSDVVLEFIEASKVGKPSSYHRTHAIACAEKYAKAVHPELFKRK